MAIDDAEASNASTAAAAAAAAARTAFVIDIYPTKLRELLRADEDISLVWSLCLNSLLAVTLMQEKNKILRPYRRVLLQNCAFDLLYTFVSFASRIELEFYQGEFAVVVNGIYRTWPKAWHYFGFGSYFFTTLMSVYVIPIVFYFRYSLVVTKVQVTGRRLTCIVLVIVVYIFFITSLLVAATLSYDGDPNRHCREVLTHPIWTHPGAPPFDNCIVANLETPFLMMYYALLGVANVIMYGTMFYCTRAVYAEMRAARPHLHAKTASVQAQMNTLLLVQLITPIFFAAIPVTAAVTACILRLEFPGMGMVAMAAFAWIPLINPCTTILLVTSYRRRAARLIATPFGYVYSRLTGQPVWPAEQCKTSDYHNTTENNTIHAIP